MSEEQTDEKIQDQSEERFEDQVEELFDFDEIIEEALQESDAEGPNPPGSEHDSSPSGSPLPKDAAELSARVNDAEERVVRAKAELENFRRRMRREMDDQLKFANQGLITELLPVIDNVYRAISAASNDEASSGLLEGFRMVAQQLASTLKKFHCEPIKAAGEVFDPNKHEAISQMPSDELEKGRVLQAIQEGYMLHDRVIRPSQVIISAGPAEQASE